MDSNYQPQETRQLNRSTASMSLGIAALVLTPVGGAPWTLLPAGVGLVLGVISRDRGEEHRGRSLTGIVCSILTIALVLIFARLPFRL